MTVRKLTKEEREQLADPVLNRVRKQIRKAAGGDAELEFAIRRRVRRLLEYDERGSPQQRARLKRRKRKQQGGVCVDCNGPLPEKGAVNDRNKAMHGYTDANVDLRCPSCDTAKQENSKYSG